MPGIPKKRLRLGDLPGNLWALNKLILLPEWQNRYHKRVVRSGAVNPGRKGPWGVTVLPAYRPGADMLSLVRLLQLGD